MARPLGSLRRTPAAVVVVIAMLASAVVAGTASADDVVIDTPSPSAWPRTAAAAPQMEGWANGLRLFGADRYQTNLALALSLTGRGGYPFTTPDRTADWWGPGRCPRAVILAAGDLPADALTAAALSDPTGGSTEPYLQRTASAIPSLYPVGDYARVDTDFAPVLVTASARQGATGLTASTVRALTELRSGRCTAARQVIIVGGHRAVPPGVEAELLALRYEQVFRVAGDDKWSTAAAVAQALGTSATAATACGDPVTSDGDARLTFHANAAVELRSSPTECRVLGRTVVLADGIDGIDALAAGWWTSFWQVPVLFHDGSSSLPTATSTALTALAVDHVLVLGGTARISEEVLAEVEALTDADVIRIAGDDRYDTSVQMARQLGGWWPESAGSGLPGSLVCVAASSGSGPTARGWPDALGSGPWCGAASAAPLAAPERGLPPTNGPAPQATTGQPRAADAVPILLVPADSSSIPAAVEDLLGEAFAPSAAWCSSASVEPGCREPGFAVVVGGPAVVAPGAVARLVELVGGGTLPSPTGRTPRLDAPFLTGLDLRPVYASADGAERVCVERDGYADLRWIAAFPEPTAAPLGAADVMFDERYLIDADGVARRPGLGAAVCVALDSPGDLASVLVRGVSPAGRATPLRTLVRTSPARFWLSAPVIAADVTLLAGIDTSLDPETGGVSRVGAATATPGVEVEHGTATALDAARVEITLTRGATTTAPDVFVATWRLETADGNVVGTARGEALLVDGTWLLRGRSVVTGGPWAAAGLVGGFSADLTVGAGGVDDDDISWQVDALAPG